MGISSFSTLFMDGVHSLSNVAVILRGEAANAAASESSGGMPQLDFTWYGSQIFWLAVTFAVLYVIVSRVNVPTIRQVLQDRQDRIVSDIEQAEDIKKQAESTLGDYTSDLNVSRKKATESLEAAQQEVASLTKERHDTLDAMLESRLAESEAKIADIRTKLSRELEPVAIALATDIVEKLTCATIKADTIEQTAKEVASNRKVA